MFECWYGWPASRFACSLRKLGPQRRGLCPDRYYHSCVGRRSRNPPGPEVFCQNKKQSCLLRIKHVRDGQPPEICWEKGRFVVREVYIYTTKEKDSVLSRSNEAPNSIESEIYLNWTNSRINASSLYSSLIKYGSTTYRTSARLR